MRDAFALFAALAYEDGWTAKGAPIFDINGNFKNPDKFFVRINISDDNSRYDRVVNFIEKLNEVRDD